MDYSDFITELKSLDYKVNESKKFETIFKKYKYCETTYYLDKKANDVYLDNPAGKIYFDNYLDTLEFINGNINLGRRSFSNYKRY